MLTGKSIDDIYPHLIREVLDAKDFSSPRGMKIRELFNYQFQIDDATRCIVTNSKRKINFAYAVMEMLGLLMPGKATVEPMCWFNSKMKNYLNHETLEWDGSYAQRLTMYDQMRNVYKVLKEDPDSRRAVMSMYNPAHDFHDYISLDICCTLSLIFRIVNGKLNLSVTMRSNDVLLGIPADLWQFSFLQSVMASWLGIPVGNYSHYAASFHAYERDLEKLTDIANSPVESCTSWERMGTWDVGIHDTFDEVSKFFAMDKELRDSKDASDDNANMLWGKYWMKSEFIRNLYFTVVLPYIRKKLIKQNEQLQ